MCPVTIFFFFFNDTATTEISPLSLHAALPIPVLEAGFRKNGPDRVGYPSIVGSGPNSTTLHYDVSRRQTRDGDLVVVDAGAEWGQYTADVTRTFPVNGKFTPRQKAIYDLVLATQQAAFDSTRPGTTIAH